MTKKGKSTRRRGAEQRRAAERERKKVNDAKYGGADSDEDAVEVVGAHGHIDGLSYPGMKKRRLNDERRAKEDGGAALNVKKSNGCGALEAAWGDSEACKSASEACFPSEDDDSMGGGICRGRAELNVGIPARARCVERSGLRNVTGQADSGGFLSDRTEYHALDETDAGGGRAGEIGDRCSEEDGMRSDSELQQQNPVGGDTQSESSEEESLGVGREDSPREMHMEGMSTEDPLPESEREQDYEEDEMDALNARVEPNPKSDEKDVFKIENAFMLLGIVLLSGRNRMPKDAYETMATSLSLGVGNPQILSQLSWRKGEVSNPEDTSRPLSAIHLKNRTHILPSRETVLRNIPKVLASLTLPMSEVLMRVNMSKVGGAAVANQYAKQHGIGYEERQKDPRCLVGFIRVSDIVKKDILDINLWKAMNSDEALREMKDSPWFWGRDDIFGFNVTIDAVRPLEPGFACSLADKAMFPDNKWRWTYVGVGDVVEVRGPRPLIPVLRQQLEMCEACVHSSRACGPAKGGDLHGYTFGIPEAIEMSDDKSLLGKIGIVWNVGGASSWGDVNEFCKNVLEDRVQAIEDVKGTLHASGDERRFCFGIAKEFRHDAADDIPEEHLLLALLLSRAAAVRPYDFKDRRTVDSRSGQTELLPWSPVKAGDTVAMVSLPKTSNDRVCPCASGEMNEDSCVLVINRWWHEVGENVRQFTFVSSISAAIDNILAVSNAQGKRDDCPFGSSTAPQNCAGKVVCIPTVERRDQDSVGSTRARVTALWIPSEGTDAGEDDFGGRDGHITAAMRRRMRSAAPTRGYTRTKDGKIMPYFVYRGYAYHDGFIKESGKPASAYGLYWGSLNLPSARRQCGGHVRIVSLLPPGTSVKDMYAVMLDDILQSAMDGIECVTADGEAILVFIDLVCVLADTPAVQEILDVGGHTSLAACHCCRYQLESEKGMGIHGGQRGLAAQERNHARYTDRAVCSTLRPYGRSVYAHHAVRVALNGEASLKRGGVSRLSRQEHIAIFGVSPRGEVDSESDGEGVAESDNVRTSPLPLHTYAKKYEEAAATNSLPRDLQGRRILPSFFCPYKGCVPVPEHLLFGLLKDAINAALKMFHNLKDVAAVNKYIGMYHEACGIVVQSQYVNTEKKALNTMTITPVYALSVVAERALRAVKDSPHRFGKGSEEEEDALEKAIDLVGSAADLLATFWISPQVADASMPDAFGELVFRHLELIDELCKKPISQATTGAQIISEAETLDIQPSARARGRVRGRGHGRGRGRSGPPLSTRTVQNHAVGSEVRKRDAKKSSDTVARGVLDMPNVHRLLELASLLHFLKHGHFIADLVCESKHQPSKDAMRRYSAQLFPHVFAVRSALLDDLKGRLCSLYKEAMQFERGVENIEPYIRGLIPLLFGRDTPPSNLMSIDDETMLKVQNILGLKEFLPKYLTKYFVSIMTPDKRAETTSINSVVWNVGHESERNTSNRSVLDDNIVRGISVASKRHFPDLMMDQWPGKVVLCPQGDKDATRVFSGQHQFLRKIESGSVISCCVNAPYSSDGLYPLLHLIPAPKDVTGKYPSSAGRSRVALPVSGQPLRYFCVDDIYTLKEDGVDAAEDQGAERRLGRNERAVSAPAAVVAVVREVLDAISDEPVSSKNINYKNALQTRKEAEQDGTNTALPASGPHFLLRLDGPDAGIRPAAVFPRCEKIEGCGAYKSGSGNSAVIVVKHGGDCGARKGGQFFIRDSGSGFPHRSS